ncbi:MAG: TonB-dependent receptor [Thermodesulfobacteriota bacterium]|nr:TonB-dependent receptor [Thermodesulfobacteriota bacterium]
MFSRKIDMRAALIWSLLVLLSLGLYGQLLARDLKTEDLLDMSLEELINVEVVVASRIPLGIRETPGIVTVITREDILKSGSRDLMDALTLLVPGVTFGADVEGAVGISLRGLWAHEGKVLLLLDGQECNDEVFATTVFGNHYPVENIEKIEIIRGPGSAIYGGYAGVGVINVITRGADHEGAWVSGLYSQMKDAYSHRNLAVGFGHKGDALSASLSAVVGQGMRSDRDSVDITGHAMTMKDNSELDPLMVNLNLNYKGLDLRAIVDRYRTTQIDLWGENYTDGPLDEDFDSYFFNVKYDMEKVGGQDLTISPEWKYKIQYPWQVVVPDTFTSEKRTEKMQFGLTGVWDITHRLNLVSGAEYYTNYIYLPDTPTEYEEVFQNGKSKIGHKNFSYYAQLMVFHDLFNTTIGGRYDRSDEYGSSFVPRVGLTKAWDRFHAKAMYSQSFRLPGGNIPNSVPPEYPDIEPEKADNFEIEVGCRIRDDMMLTLNAFDVSFDDAIVYVQDTETGTGSYFNSGKYGSRGLEAVYRFQGERFDLSCNYAYYRVSTNNVSLYEVPGHDHTFLAFPQHRFNVLAGIEVSDRFSIHPSLSYFGKRYGYVYDRSTGDAAVEAFDPTFICNVNFRLKNVFRQGLEIDFGAKDLFDAGYEYIQAYDAGHAPLPAPSRALYLRVAYAF